MKIYAVSGESYLLINEEVNKIVKDNKNVTIFDYNNDTMDAIMIEAHYVSMFLEDKYIIVKNANFLGTGKISEKDSLLLLNYLDEPCSNTVIIFICNEKVDMRKKIVKVIKEKYTLKVIDTLKVYEISERVKKYFERLDFKISSESINYIISNNLNNYDMIMNEAYKITLYYEKPGFIKHEDVINITSKALNSNNFLWVDAVVANDLEKSLELFKDLKAMKVEPSVLISLLARDFRFMFNIKKMQEAGIREYSIMNELGLMDWQLNRYLNKVFPYKLKELESIMSKLSQLDLDIKSGKIDRFMGLELFILDICA